ncbi:MAG TPA: methyltransferase domain-containing protein [Oscillatoriales cyanobacterium M59_W2019_021]|nr:MAG: methyltransferase domain-containing protein [Cyanobacteria bacterium J055]HIK30381.1 methyltransferase domain-containing protein [Oscillatoriales cyanobacterium M4454_W2019_049]HIK51778.1 methyltransferase domain-containing protein [Oscillatoriales cyanobacterium M59_W2019_021]
MATGTNTLWDRFLAPIVRSFIDEEALQRFDRSVDWEAEVDRLHDSTLVYPDYYRSQNFHGIRGGYLTSGAAVSYDPITGYVLPPNETWVRQSAIEAITVRPRRILDLGCGTGSQTLMLKRAFPQAETIGLDFSPYMLFMGEYKAKNAGLEIGWRHGSAENTGFADRSFDLIALALVFHETPTEISQAILRECYRLLSPGGEVIVLDGNQQALRQTDWLTEVFEEPYIKEYSAGNVADWMRQAGFAAVTTRDFWWIHQVTRGVKPSAGSSPEVAETPDIADFDLGALAT